VATDIHLDQSRSVLYNILMTTSNNILEGVIHILLSTWSYYMENIFNHLYAQILVNILMRPRFVKDNKNFIVEISGLIFPHLAISLKI
jgi:hypothetical protein